MKPVPLFRRWATCPFHTTGPFRPESPSEPASYEVRPTFPQLGDLPASYDWPVSGGNGLSGPRRMKPALRLPSWVAGTLHTRGPFRVETGARPASYEARPASPQLGDLPVSYDWPFPPGIALRARVV